MVSSPKFAPQSPVPWLATLGAGAVVFALDVLAPSAYSVGILYVLTIWAATLIRRNGVIFLTAFLCSLLLLLATWLDGLPAERISEIIGSRVAILLAIWFSALAGVMLTRSRGDLAARNIKLEAEVAARTSEVRKTMTRLTTEVQERQQATAERDRFFDASLDMLCLARRDGYFHRVSLAFERTLGFSTEEILATPFLDLIHPDDRASTQAEVNALHSR